MPGPVVVPVPGTAINVGGGGVQGVISGVVNTPQVVVLPKGGPGISVGGGTVVTNPWWNIPAILTLPPVPVVVVAKHNQVFLEGCDPHLCILNEAATYHSMSNEDESLYEIFYTNPIKCCRVIVEIGVGDGDRYSVSKFFEDALNWRSLLIEANPDVYKELEKNRPATKKVNGAFCESDSLQFDNGNFHAVGGSVEVSSELHSPASLNGTERAVPCLKMDTIFSGFGITKVDMLVIRVAGDALAYIRSMDWTVRVDIWVVLMHGTARQERDELVRTVLKNNEYVQAEWDIKRWCAETGACLNNEVFLRKGFNPLPCELAEAQRHLKHSLTRNLRGSATKDSVSKPNSVN